MVMTNRNARHFFWALLAVTITCGSALAQDHVRGSSEPIVNSIDPAKLTYDILVDGNLERDDPANRRFKTLQAAYADLGSRLGRTKRPTEVTSLFVAAAAVALTAAAGLSLVRLPGLP